METGRAGKLKEILRSVVEGLGYESVGIELSTGRSGQTLRMYIDAPQGVGHEECRAASQAVIQFLDRCEEEGAPWFAGKYFLEVSSPGIERPLFTPEHYRRFVGNFAAIALRGGKKTRGVIEGWDEAGEAVLLRREDGSQVAIPFGGIRRGNLLYVPQENGKKGRKDGRKDDAAG